MARARGLYHSRALAVALASGSAASISYAAYPRRTAYAESPEDIPDRKPIYSDFTPAASPSTPTLPLAPTESTQNSALSPPTPTDRLAAQIKRLRLTLYDLSLSTEQSFNNALTYAFRKETQVADTLAGLAPGPETGEQLLPGAIYVLVATLAGSIVTRNRNILLRASVPLGVGVTAGWTLIPVTMRNVGDLLWEYEKKVPVVADSHLQVRQFGEDAWRRLRESGKVVVDKVDASTGEGRKMIEGWVEKGK